MAGKVDDEHAVAPHELRQHLHPVLSRAPEPVHEQERLALAADAVTDAGGHLRLEARCSRHPRNVSFENHGDSWDAGPLIPANNERAMSRPA